MVVVGVPQIERSEMQVSKSNNHQQSPYFYKILEVYRFKEHCNGETETAELVKLSNDLLTCAWPHA